MTELQEHIPEPAGSGNPPERLSFVDQHNVNPLLFAFASLVLIFILYQIGGGLLLILATGKLDFTEANVWVVRWMTMLGQLCFIFVPTLLLTRLFTTRSSTVFQFRVPGVRESLFVLIALFSLQRILEAYMFFQEQIPIPESLRNFVEPLKYKLREIVKIIAQADSPLELGVVILVIAVVPAIVEELLFRGLIQKTFERIMSPLVSAILAGTIFGLYHLNPFEAVPLIGLGVFLGLLRYRSQSLVMPICAHFLNNLMAVLALYYGLNDEHLLSSAHAAVNMPGMLFELAAFSILFVISIIAYLRITHDTSRSVHM